MTNKEISELITRYLKGELSDSEEDRLWIEFLKDEKTFRKFETELNLYDLFQNKGYSLEDADIQVNEPQKKYRVWFYVAATVLLLLTGMYSFYGGGTGAESVAQAEIELSEMLGSDIHRDDESTMSEADYAINRALAEALDGETEKAFSILDNLEAGKLSGQQKVRVQFNRGILAYNLGRYNQSADYFEVAAEIETAPDYLKGYSLWYRANSLIKLNETELAKDLLKSIIENDMPKREEAEALLETL